MASDFESKILKITPGRFNRHKSAAGDFGPQTVRASLASNISFGDVVQTQLTLHVKHVKLSTPCMKHLNQVLKGDKRVKLQWTFYGFQQEIVSPEVLQGFKLKLDFTGQYHLDVDEEFLATIQEKPVTFKISVVDESKELVFVSEACLYLGNILEAINNKQSSRLMFYNSEIDPVHSVAYLEIWYKFICHKKNMRELYEKLHQKDLIPPPFTNLFDLDDTPKGKALDTVEVTNSEIDHFADDLLLVLNRNKALKTSQSEINRTLEERVRWLRYEADWKLTLQENAILHGKNPLDVDWRQWREEDTANLKLRTYSNIVPETYQPEFFITVVKLHFLEDSAPLLNDEVEQIYVEYSFLSQEGPQMETPFSVAKGDANHSLVFNFTKKFDIDIDNNYENCKLFTEMIKNNEIIKFVVISEPLESLEKPIQTCFEVGFTEVRLDDIIQLEDNIDIYQYEILDYFNQIDVIGYLTLKFEGILAARRMALTLMAPKGYKLFF